MPETIEIVKCPKCGEKNAKVYVIDSPKGWKVGKCHSAGCGFWGKLERIDPSSLTEGKGKARKKAKEAEPAPVETAPPSGGGCEPEPSPHNPSRRERSTVPWWNRDIFDLFSEDSQS